MPRLIRYVVVVIIHAQMIHEFAFSCSPVLGLYGVVLIRVLYLLGSGRSIPTW